METLRKTVVDYSDSYLLEQYFKHKEEYTPEALEIMQEELARRNLGQEDLDKLQETTGKTTGTVSLDGPIQTIHLDRENFEAFEHVFSRTDLLLAHAVLRENNIPFFVDNPLSTDTIPLETEALKHYTIHVHKDFTGKVHELLDEHFVKADGFYSSRYTDAGDRLRTFNFHDLHLTELEAAEQLDVALTEEEKSTIITYGQRMLDEADQIEEKQERVLFYYDAIEPLIELLQDSKRSSLSRTDLLAMLEVMQVFYDDPQFPKSMNDAISTLLGIFLN